MPGLFVLFRGGRDDVRRDAGSARAIRGVRPAAGVVRAAARGAGGGGAGLRHRGAGPRPRRPRSGRDDRAARGRDPRPRCRGVPGFGGTGGAVPGVGVAAVRGHLAGAGDRRHGGPRRRGGCAPPPPTRHGPFVVVAPALAAIQGVPPDPAATSCSRASLAKGAEVAPDALAERWSHSATSRADVVEHRGEFAVRGGTVDVFPGASRRPVRAEFWGTRSTRCGSSRPRRSCRPQRWARWRCTRPGAAGDSGGP